ncbi:unnamed protein product [Blepharisma stoltei]|uniref:Calreticulin n=1 Tax=Blepharisma stoltei TaxID=1481888 RepID=A0AAU9JPJ6_9CILI|nr:unnamed protein product [Blepharisma stoltei]
MKWAVPLFLVSLASATVYFQEEFDTNWESRWVNSNWKTDGSQAKFRRSAGDWYVDAEKDQGLQTTEDYRFYGISSKFPGFSNQGKPLVVQFTVKMERNVDCGGGYIKILPDGFDQSTFGGDTPYLIMFGPDICGSEKKTHLIVAYKGKNYLNTKRFRCEIDSFTHQYTAIFHPDNTYEFLIDDQEVSKGKLEEHWDILPKKEIKDPSAKKPEDWVDEPTLPDPEDKKPEGWDDIPELISDPSASKPEDWEDKDGEWKAPMIPNPDYKGEWRPKMIPNPGYKGPWTAPLIPNPDYVEEPNLHAFGTYGGVGIELWQVTSGMIFDNIIITDSVEEAKAFSEKNFAYRKAGEPDAKKVYDDAEEAKRPKPAEPEEHDFEGREDL